MIESLKKNILFIAPSLHTGGAEKFLINLINGIDRNKYNAFLIVLHHDNPIIQLVRSDVKIWELRRKSRFDWNLIKEVSRITKHTFFSHVFCLGYYSYMFYRFSFLFNNNVKGQKHYISYHSTKPVSVKDNLLNWFYRGLLHKKSKFVFVCHSQRRFIEQKYKIKNESLVIYNGIDTLKYTLPPSAPDHLKSKFGLDLNRSIIVKIAMLRTEKGHFYAVHALKVLKEKYNKEPYLLFVGGGTGAYVSQLKAEVSRFGLTEQVKFIDVVEDVREYLWISSVFTLASTSIETFSLAALEGMSCGLPAVLTDIGGANELINSSNGILVDPGNVEELAKGWNLVLDGKYNSDEIHRDIASKFDVNLMIRNYETLVFD